MGRSSEAGLFELAVAREEKPKGDTSRMGNGTRRGSSGSWVAARVDRQSAAGNGRVQGGRRLHGGLRCAQRWS